MTADLDQLQRESWRRAAGAWGRRQAELREATAPVSQWLVDALDPQPGQRLLELAAGPGETGFIAAQRIAPDGTLLSTDQSPEMVEVAKRRASELGLQNVEFEVIDAQKLDLEAQSFDAVVCRWGYMLMGDPDAALRNTHRVLRPGGRLALATWGTPDRNLWMAAPVIQLVSRGHMPVPDPAVPTPFSMPDPDALAARLSSNGFNQARAERLEFTQIYPSFDEYWSITLDLAAPVKTALDEVGEGAVAEVRQGVEEMLMVFRSADGSLTVPATAIVATAQA